MFSLRTVRKLTSKQSPVTSSFRQASGTHVGKRVPTNDVTLGTNRVDSRNMSAALAVETSRTNDIFKNMEPPKAAVLLDPTPKMPARLNFDQ